MKKRGIGLIVFFILLFSISYVLGENSIKHGIPNGECNTKFDFTCDPDCGDADPDCFNIRMKDCGNGLCQDNESYFVCPVDCRSGQDDGYCDKISDGICDPDCVTGDFDCEVIKREETETKEKSYLNMLYIIIPTVFIILLIGFYYFYIKANTITKDEMLRLKEYIAISLDRGLTKEQIMHELIKDGWEKKILENEMSQIKKPTHLNRIQMLNLQNYIMNISDRGYKKPQIINELIHIGWTKNQINEAYAEIKKPTHLNRIQMLNLQNYIMNISDRGYKKPQIINELIRIGWTKNQINEAYAEMK